MPRLTRAGIDGRGYMVDEDKVRHDGNGCSGEAIDRLALFENVLDKVVKTQGDITAELDTLRKEGKRNTVRFRELLGKKLVNNEIMNLLELHGLI